MRRAARRVTREPFRFGEPRHESVRRQGPTLIGSPILPIVFLVKESESNHGTSAVESGHADLDLALARMVFEQGYSLLLLGSICLLLCAALLHEVVPAGVLAWWLAAGTGTVLLRLPLVVGVSRRPDRRLPLNAMLALVMASGAVWGALALFWSPELALADQLVLVMFPMTIALGTIAAYGACPPLYFAFVVPVQLPFAIVFLSTPGHDKLALVMVFAFFFQTLLVRRYHHQVAELFRLRMGNEALVRDLSSRNVALSAARDEARGASEAKSEFLSRMSHEIRTPMNGVLGVSELLSATPLDAMQTRLLDALRDSGRSLLVLLERLLDISSVEQGRFSLEKRDYAPRELFEEVMREELPRARARTLSLRWSVDSSVPSRLHGDPSRLGQIVRHLIDNALRFTEEGGVRVHLTVERRESDAPRLVLSVADSGIGMAEEEIDVVFEPFRQGRARGGAHGGGTGLGLALVREFSALMDGTVRVTSSPGAGSTFVVELPMQRASPASGADGPGSGRASDESGDLQPIRTALTVLVAEDNPVNQMVIEAMLESMGCTVTLVENGAEALDALDSRPFDIVFMDCRMPVVDGLEAARTARRRGHALPIVAVTAEALPGDRERCLAAGMSDYMSKPLHQRHAGGDDRSLGRRARRGGQSGLRRRRRRARRRSLGKTPKDVPGRRPEPSRSASGPRLPERLDAPCVRAEVAVADARGAADPYDACSLVDQELDVVDVADEGAGEGGVEVIAVAARDRRVGTCADQRDEGVHRLVRRPLQWQGLDAPLGIGRIRTLAVR